MQVSGSRGGCPKGAQVRTLRAMNPARPHVEPRRQIGVWQAISVCVGMVIGAGIFKSPSLVAANVGSDLEMLLAWAFGGAMSLAGALCFAEMASAFPDPGGDYHFLRRALGLRAGFLFAWSRFAVNGASVPS